MKNTTKKKKFEDETLMVVMSISVIAALFGVAVFAMLKTTTDIL